MCHKHSTYVRQEHQEVHSNARKSAVPTRSSDDTTDFSRIVVGRVCTKHSHRRVSVLQRPLKPVAVLRMEASLPYLIVPQLRVLDGVVFFKRQQFAIILKTLTLRWNGG